MNSSETSIWQWLSNGWKQIPRTLLQANRVENTAGSGMPDVEGFYPPDQFWIELKAAGRPANSTTNIDVKHLRPKQVEWLHNRWLIGGNAWILLRIDGKNGNAYYLIPGKYSRQVKAGLTEDELFDLSKIPVDAHPMEILRACIRYDKKARPARN